VRTRIRRSHNRRDNNPERPYNGGVADEGDDMHHELRMTFEAIRGYQTRGYPIELELRHAQRDRRRLFPALRARVVRLLLEEEKP
jgi:hypothetical protein